MGVDTEKDLVDNLTSLSRNDIPITLCGDVNCTANQTVGCFVRGAGEYIRTYMYMYVQCMQIYDVFSLIGTSY